MAACDADAFMDALHRLEEHNDAEAIVSLFAEDAELSSLTDAAPHHGREGARRYWEQYRGAFEEVRSEFRNVVSSDGIVVLEWTSRGRGVEGRPFEYDGVSVLEFRDGKVRRFRSYFDPAELRPALSRRRS